MRTALLFSLVVMAWTSVHGQTAPAPPKPQTQTPAAPAPVRRAPPAAAARATLLLTVTDQKGATIPDVRVEVLGQADRRAETDGSGQVRFTNLPAGTYRMRFSGDGIITLEREVTVRAGAPTDLHVALNPAPVVKAPEPPPPPPPPPPPAPAKAPVGPAGQPQSLSIVDLVERELIKNEPRRETLVACSGNTRTMLVQLNQDLPQRTYEGAEATYYVIAGEGFVRINGRDTALAAGGFASVPRGMGHVLGRRGRRPFIVLSTLSGEPCEEVK